MTKTVQHWLFLLCCAAGVGAPLALGLNYSDRVSSHQGFFLIGVSDAVPPQLAPPRPRRTVLVVFDGLGYHEALTMRSLEALRGRGQCRKTDVGSLSLSRPLYAVFSTGLEQDRTGSRGNDDESPLAAESIWQVARAAGRSVSGVSTLAWWQQLFPRGFSTYLTKPEDADLFRQAPPAELQLIHPIYIDEAGHAAGAGSQRYRDAVARADRELAGFLATLDLQRDLIVVTADHGHSLRGGHGGLQERIAQVLTCYAGPGVRTTTALGAMRATTVAPSLALLLGLRFPADMRAGDDDLDTLWSLVDPAAFPTGYLADRQTAVTRFRTVNQATLRRWHPESEGRWPIFYAWQRGLQLRAALPFLALMLLVLGAHHAAHRRLAWERGERGHCGPDEWCGRAWMLLFLLGGYGLQVLLRGSFDMSSVSNRADFLHFTVALGIGWAGTAVGLHYLLRRRFDTLRLDLAALCLLGALASLVHPASFGWHLGFPLPPPELYFFPYFAALFFASLGGVAALLGLLEWLLTAHADSLTRRGQPRRRMHL